MPVRPAPRMRARVLSRRGFLGGATALVAAGATLPGCAEDPGEKALTPEGTIPPITPNDDFYVTSCCGTPEVGGNAWALVIRDRGVEVARITLAELDSLATRTKEHTLECIGAGPYNHAISNAVWTGLPLRDLFEALGVTVAPEIVELKLTSADEYSTGLPFADLDTVWIVTAMNGEPLPPAHGYPARLLVPGRYGMKNPKWLVGIELVDTPHVGFWESRGWSNEARYRTNTLVHQPDRYDNVVEAGPVRVLGTAFAGDDPVVRVEIALDDGPWADVSIDYAPGADIWTVWHADFDLAPGTHVVRTRCTTASGATTSDDPEGTDPLGGYDGGMELTIEAV